MTRSDSIPLFELGQSLGRALCGRHDQSPPDDAWRGLLHHAVEISDRDPDVITVTRNIRTAVDDLISPATTYLYAEWSRRGVSSEAARSLLDGISNAALR